MTREEYINQIIEIGNTLQIHPNSPKGQTLKKCIELLSAVPERKKGEWIELPKAFNANENPCECSKCGHVLSFMNGYPKSKFCPNCGADMRGGKE